MTQPTENGQAQHPESYTLPADLVANIYQLLAQVPSGNAARVYVRLENEIGRQNAAWQQAQAEPVPE